MLTHSGGHKFETVLIWSLIVLANLWTATSKPVLELDEQLPYDRPKLENATSSHQGITCSAVNQETAALVQNFPLSSSLWRQFTVYIDPAYDESARALITSAVNRLAQVITCIKFQVFPKKSLPSGDYVHIVLGGDNICESVIGKTGGRQTVTLGRNCLTTNIIIHELMHSLGVEHEQNRPDRDNFVTVLWQNIRPGMERNFKKSATSQVATYGVPYNYNSIMHYRSTDFSNNGKPTIVAKDGGAIGPAGLQATDELRLKRMYGCQ